MHLDMVRPGIALYGCPPFEAPSLRPVLSWKAHITHLKWLAKADAVSYGALWHADEPRLIATLPVGYGDGYSRSLTGKAQVLIGGRRANIVGRICMDQMMADVTDIPGVKVGDEAVIIGRQGEECITAEEAAAWRGTISYEVFTNIADRVPRVYVHG